MCSDPALADQTSYVHRLARRKAVTRWLMQAAASTVEKEVSASGDTVSASKTLGGKATFVVPKIGVIIGIFFHKTMGISKFCCAICYPV